MSQIDPPGKAIISHPTAPEKTDISHSAVQQRIPAPRPLQAQLQELRAASLLETMESMSLMVGSRLRANDKKMQAKDSSAQLHEMLMHWVPKVEGATLATLTAQFSQLGWGDADPLMVMQQAGTPPGAMALLLASLLEDQQLDPRRRKRLEKALADLLADDNVTLDILAYLDPMELGNSDLLPLKQLWQRTRQDEQQTPQGMSAWFNEVRHWPERRSRLRLLIRALALELAPEVGEQLQRIVAAMNELKRLLLFLSVEDFCRWVANDVGIDAEQMLTMLILLLDQSWVYADWLEQQLYGLHIAEKQIFRWLRQMLELLRMLPAPCFQDEEQCGQLIEAFEQLQQRWCERAQAPR
ncbi:TyeA family type III secretion system gatekeeper subunit [Serratia quinivorans]|uniref:TyeA family type III secretion system gatekeeper subunit n=1 Tax=Serratia quinivorans TaxID=137545 RepID=UPI00217B2EF4|nr:TyeA family type III secretion system gatekeeper subunit [Serratia quinivorans]CAI1009324.1 type III secretion system protein SsaL [Serratia quinivorans]CAI1809884.1 type III secretion system protein SsaL [Serratia quinivorans]